MAQKIDVYKTETYKKSLKKFDNKIAKDIDKKVMKLLENPSIAERMKYNHELYCEIKIGKKYRVYCIKKQNQIGLLFIIGPAVHHKANYGDQKEYGKLFGVLDKLDEEFSKVIK